MPSLAARDIFDEHVVLESARTALLWRADLGDEVLGRGGGASRQQQHAGEAA